MDTVSEQMSQKKVNITKYNELKVVFIEQLQQEWTHLLAEHEKNFVLNLLKKTTTSTYEADIQMT